jgi:2'-5' RNA ligase
MSRAATVVGGERLRLFLGLCLPAETTQRLADWQSSELSGRIVPPENLHVTLAFLGSRPRSDLDAVARELEGAAGVARPPVLVASGYRETRSVGMLVLDDLEGSAGAFAEGLHERLERLGVYRREARTWLPHVTVVRFRERPRLRPSLPDLGPVSPSGLALYHSLLRPGGAQYGILKSVVLGG